MVLSEQKFTALAGAYKLSPRQREIARHILSGRVHDAELTKAMAITQRNLGSQMNRMCKKMHCRGRTEILYRFWHDSLSVTPANQKS